MYSDYVINNIKDSRLIVSNELLDMRSNDYIMYVVLLAKVIFSCKIKETPGTTSRLPIFRKVCFEEYRTLTIIISSFTQRLANLLNCLAQFNWFFG